MNIWEWAHRYETFFTHFCPLEDIQCKKKKQVCTMAINHLMQADVSYKNGSKWGMNGALV